jgi:SAM-dependent methyltransferase
LEWTGERYVTSLGGEIEFEHTHRYLFAMPFAQNAAVLDIASGEGYGSALLSFVAHQVIGIEIDNDSVTHSQNKYQSDNLKFVRADCTAIPLSSNSIDLVVSFETLEHIIGHAKFLSEISRVLKPDGVLVASTPDRVSYNEVIAAPNPYHLKELDRAEFRLLLNRHFQCVEILGQCYLEGSLIDPLRGCTGEETETKSNKRWVHYIEEPISACKRLVNPIYLIGVASNQPLPKRPVNLLTTALGRQARWRTIREVHEGHEAGAREADELRARLAQAEEKHGGVVKALRAEIERHRATEATLRAEIEQRVTNEVALHTEIAPRAQTAAATEALQRENDVLRGKLGEVEQRCKDYEAARDRKSGRSHNVE